jgi:parallel beta-helix repeat protein
VVVDKTLAIVSLEKNLTIIDGNNNGPAVSIISDNTYLLGFTITNSSSSWWDSGVYIHADNVTMSDNIITENSYGIIFEYANNTVITGNLIFNNSVDGIKGNRSIYKSTISNNIVHNNRNGIALDDEYLDITRNHKVFENTIFNNSQVGVFCYRNEGTEVYDNSLTGPLSHGIYIQEGQSNLVYDNTIEETEKGIWLLSTSSNKIFHNYILNNTAQASDNGFNQWDDGYPSGGNYWSDYSGPDNYNGPNQDIIGGDGFGDTEHPISGGSNKDNYPFMDIGWGAPYPTIDEVKVTYTPDGVEVDFVFLDVGMDITLYASAYNDSSGYLGLIDVDWSQSPNDIGAFNITYGTFTTFNAGFRDGSTSISGVNSTLGISDSFMLTINAPTINYIQIRNEANDLGIEVTTDTFTLGGVVTENYYCAGYNDTSGYIEDVTTAAWTLDIMVGTIDPAVGSITLFTATIEGTTTLMTNVSGITDTITIIVEPEGDITRPAAPTGVTVVTGSQAGSLVITWNANTEANLAGYNIYRSNSASGPFIKLNSVLITDTTYINSGLGDATTYYYRITAQDTFCYIADNLTTVLSTIV